MKRPIIFPLMQLSRTPPPAGTVPVRYVVAPTANVVPVKTVNGVRKRPVPFRGTQLGFMSLGAGLMPIHEVVGPANVVPVREAITESPNVLVMHQV